MPTKGIVSIKLLVIGLKLDETKNFSASQQNRVSSSSLKVILH